MERGRGCTSASVRETPGEEAKRSKWKEGGTVIWSMCNSSSALLCSKDKEERGTR